MRRTLFAPALFLILIPLARGQDKKEPEKVVEVKVEDLGGSFRDNEVRAETDWVGKRVRMKVMPIRITKNDTGAPIVGVYSGFSGQTPQPDMAIQFKKDAVADVAKLEKGKPFTVEATVIGVKRVDAFRFVVLKDAVVVAGKD